MELRIAIRIFDERERRHLGHILSLVTQRGRVKPVLVSAADAEIIFLKKDEPGSAFFEKAGRAQSLPLPVFYGGEVGASAWHLNKPATSGELMPLLESLHHEVATLSAMHVAPSAEAPTSPTEVSVSNHALIPTATGQALLTCLLSRASGPRYWYAQLDSNDHLVIDAQERVVHVSPRYLKRLPILFEVLMAMNSTDFVAMSEPDFAELRFRLEGEFQLMRVQWEQFVWSACQHAEPLMPLPREMLEVPFRLRRWPAFTRLNYTITHMQWSGNLIKSAASVTQLATWGGTLAEAAKFYNACMVSGLVSVEDALVSNVNINQSVERLGIFQRVLQRLRSS